MKLRVISGVMSALLAVAATALAQQGTSEVRGRVTDPSSGVLPGATVVIRTPDGTVVSSTTAGADGRYRLDAVTPGRYAVEFFTTVKTAYVVPKSPSTTDASATLISVSGTTGVSR